MYPNGLPRDHVVSVQYVLEFVCHRPERSEAPLLHFVLLVFVHRSHIMDDRLERLLAQRAFGLDLEHVYIWGN